MTPPTPSTGWSSSLSSESPGTLSTTPQLLHAAPLQGADACLVKCTVAFRLPSAQCRVVLVPLEQGT